jgi:hypothetical protein
VRGATASRFRVLQFPAMGNLDAIVKELKQERDRLDAAIEALASLGTSSRTRTRRMSAAARRRISAAQRARWAKQKKVVPIRGRRHISAQGLANIRAAAKKRWAKVGTGKK